MPKVTIKGKTTNYPYTPAGMKAAHKASMKPTAKMSVHKKTVVKGKK